MSAVSIGIPLPVAVVGLGLTGRSVLRLLQKLGIPRDRILSFDQKDPEAEFRDPVELMSRRPGTLVVSPGVPLALDWIQSFRAGGGLVTSELTLATSVLTSERIVGVTGSIGKSTCVSLLRAGLDEFSPGSFAGGNLGVPLADYAFEVLNGRDRADWVVLELSSYQLENYDNLSAHGALITYLTPNHMERYPDLETYYRTKWTLVEKTKGPVVLNGNGGDLRAFASGRPGNLAWVEAGDGEFAALDFSKARLLGEHNRDNLRLVTALSRALGWPDSAVRGFFAFPGLPHRLENLGTRNGVLYINDSKATTIESALQALRSTAGLVPGRVHVLIGGKDKNLPWKDLSAAADPRRVFHFFGEVAERARRDSGLRGEIHASLAGAIDSALAGAIAGDLVLLSPGGTSLDEFRSFEERGDFFRSRISGR